MPARAENVALVRHVIGALAEALALPPRVIEDMRLAVTEACTNVVRHAYDGSGGPMEVAVVPLGDSVTVTVSDRGRGGAPSPDTAGPRLGLRVMAALSESIEVQRLAGRGSRVRMSFPLERSASPSKVSP